MSSTVPPPPPPPPLPPYTPRGPEKRPTPKALPKPPGGSFGIGIETEFLLRSRETPPGNENSLRQFARRCANTYNNEVSAPFPRMHSLVQAQWEGIPHTQWALHHDPTCETQSEPWGIELISPLLRAFPNSQWREDVRATWEFLCENCFISGDENCSTHVHISRAEDFSAADLKRVAQAIIHFEQAFEAILPEERRANEYARSNWIDNPHFAYQNLSRDQSIDFLEDLTTINQVIDAMNPNQSKYFGWNFLSVRRFKTIEFRRGAVSLSVNDVFMWAELAMSFIRAALALQSTTQLRQYPRTVGGLRSFIQYAQLSTQQGMHNPTFLNPLFSGKASTDRANPVPVGTLSPAKQAKLQRKIAADSVSNPVLDMMSSAQQYHVM